MYNNYFVTDRSIHGFSVPQMIKLSGFGTGSLGVVCGKTHFNPFNAELTLPSIVLGQLMSSVWVKVLIILIEN